MGFIILSVGIVCCICFLIGYNIGIGDRQRESKPILNPIKIIETKKQEKHDFEIEKKEQEEYETILQNIDNYDGTSRGQKELPR